MLQTQQLKLSNEKVSGRTINARKTVVIGMICSFSLVFILIAIGMYFFNNNPVETISGLMRYLSILLAVLIAGEMGWKMLKRNKK